MEKARKKLLKQVSTRKLIASVKKDLRKYISAAAKPKKD
jgi:hypothetical protein